MRQPDPTSLTFIRTLYRRLREWLDIPVDASEHACLAAFAYWHVRYFTKYQRRNLYSQGQRDSMDRGEFRAEFEGLGPALLARISVSHFAQHGVLWSKVFGGILSERDGVLDMVFCLGCSPSTIVTIWRFGRRLRIFRGLDDFYDSHNSIALGQQIQELEHIRFCNHFRGMIAPIVGQFRKLGGRLHASRTPIEAVGGVQENDWANQLSDAPTIISTRFPFA